MGFAHGPSLHTRPTPALVCDDPEAELEAVLAGLAYGQLPAYLAQPYLENGRLQAVLTEQAPDPWQLFIYRPPAGPGAAKGASGVRSPARLLLQSGAVSPGLRSLTTTPLSPAKRPPRLSLRNLPEAV